MIKEKTKRKNLSINILCIVVMLFWAGIVIYGIYSGYRYEKLYDKAVTVEAVVVDHSIDSDDDGADYYSYISYTYGNRKYERIRYQRTSSIDDLAEIGETVFVEVNPENHGELMKNIADSGIYGALFAAHFFSFI